MNVHAPHDPGGRVRIALPDGVIGQAEFYGPNGCYRPWLSRVWDRGPLLDYVLYIGLNPSTATAEVSDPTIVREMKFATREGHRAFVKCNVFDFRATSPTAMIESGISPSSDINLSTIERFAEGAAKIICCWGSNRALTIFGNAVEPMLRSKKRELLCFGLNADGSPKHPLYLRGDTRLVPFEENR